MAFTTSEQRNSVPSWLPAERADSTFSLLQILHNSNPAHWLPAYCAHAFSNFAEEHPSVLANPDTFASLPPKSSTHSSVQTPRRPKNIYKGPRIFTRITVRCRCWLQDRSSTGQPSRRLRSLNRLIARFACNLSKVMTVVMYQAILIPRKTLLPPINSVSSPTAIFALYQTSWRHSLSSTLRPPTKVADSSTPPMVLLRLLKVAQSKNTPHSTYLSRSFTVWSLLLLG